MFEWDRNALPRWMRYFEDNPWNIPAIPQVDPREWWSAVSETVPEYEERKLAEDVAARKAAQDQAAIDLATSQSQRRMPGTTSQQIDTYVASEKERKKGETKEDNLMQQAFLMSLMENMQGGDIGQAPGVVAGGGQRPFPTMMGQIAPWDQQKPYWWIA